MRETRRTLEAATIELALEAGLENVTVEQIAERAVVSPRTFFNYFSSKEDALLGLSPDRWEADLLSGFPRRPSGAGVYVDLREFLIAHFQERVVADELLEKRIAALSSSPELMKRHLNQMTVLLEKLTLLTARLLATEGMGDAATAASGAGAPDRAPTHEAGSAGPGAGSPEPAAASPTPEQVAEAHMLLLVCGAALDHAFRSWLTSGMGSRPADSIASAFTRLERTVAHRILTAVG